MIDLGRTYLPNTALVSHSQRVYAIVGEDDTLPVPVLNREWLFIMEALVYGGSLDQAYQRFSGDVGVVSRALSGSLGSPYWFDRLGYPG